MPAVRPLTVQYYFLTGEDEYSQDRFQRYSNILEKLLAKAEYEIQAIPPPILGG